MTAGQQPVPRDKLSRRSFLRGALGATAHDHAAIFYNPAGLVVRKKVHFGATLQLVAPLGRAALAGRHLAALSPRVQHRHSEFGASLHGGLGLLLVLRFGTQH